MDLNKVFIILSIILFSSFVSASVTQFHDQCTSEGATPHMIQGTLYPTSNPWQCYDNSGEIKFRYLVAYTSAHYNLCVKLDNSNGRSQSVWVDGEKIIDAPADNLDCASIPISKTSDGSFTISVKNEGNDNAAMTKIDIFNEDGAGHGESCWDSVECVQSEDDLCIDSNGDTVVDTCSYCSANNGEACDASKVDGVTLGMCVMDYPSVSCLGVDIAYHNGNYETCDSACGMDDNYCGYDNQITPLCDHDVVGPNVEWVPDGVCASLSEGNHICDGGLVCKWEGVSPVAYMANCDDCDDGDACDIDTTDGFQATGICQSGACCDKGEGDDCEADSDCDNVCTGGAFILMEGDCTGACECDYKKVHTCDSSLKGTKRICDNVEYCCSVTYSGMGDTIYQWTDSPQAETGARACNDKIDNDCDGDIDEDDSGCEGPVEICDNGRDDDDDGRVDCDDGECNSECETYRESECRDGIDNDGDGKTDCCDSTDCAETDPLCGKANEANFCSDGVDNDCDGKIDCADSDCNCDSDKDDETEPEENESEELHLINVTNPTNDSIETNKSMGNMTPENDSLPIIKFNFTDSDSAGPTIKSDYVDTQSILVILVVIIVILMIIVVLFLALRVGKKKEAPLIVEAEPNVA